MPPQDNPYAEFGGTLASQPPPQAPDNPYAEFGGTLAQTPTSQSSIPTMSAAPEQSWWQKAGSVINTLGRIPTDPLGLIRDWAASPTQTGPESTDQPTEIGELTQNAKRLTQIVQPEAEALAGGVGGGEEETAQGVGKVATAAKEAITGAPKTEAELAEEGNQLLRTKPKDFRNQVVPGRSIVRESVDPDAIESANNARLAKDTVGERQHMETIRTHLQSSIENLKEQQATLLKHPTGKGFDIRPIVEDSYQKALESAKQTGSTDIVKAINKAHEEMIKIPNDDGELVAERYLNHEEEPTAEATNEVKKTFQGRSNYNAEQGGRPDTPTLEANKLWKDVAAKVRVRLEDQVPGLGDVNSRIRDASAAVRLADKRINTLRGMPPLPSRMSRLVKAAKPALLKGAAAAAGGAGVYGAYKSFLSGE